MVHYIALPLMCNELALLWKLAPTALKRARKDLVEIVIAQVRAHAERRIEELGAALAWALELLVLLAVLLHVQVEFLLCAVALLADLAGEALWPRVQAQVLLQVVDGGELFGAAIQRTLG